jgi:transketolase
MVSPMVLNSPLARLDKVNLIWLGVPFTMLTGKGISSAVGLAIGQAHMGAVFNRDGFPLVTNHTYGLSACTDTWNLFADSIPVFVGDGCLQEGVASEACSLAGFVW